MSGLAPCQYKDKWPRPLADQREGSPKGRGVDTAQGRRRLYSPKPVIPKHVRKCQHNGGKDWSIWVWARQNPAKVTRVPYSCGSWRCDTCRRHEGAVSFARIREAFDGIDHDRICFFVLTIDRSGYYSGEPWKNEREAYQAISRNERRFLKRVNRQLAIEGYETIQSRKVSTVEAHKSGWPHNQILLVLPKEWADELREYKEANPGSRQRTAKARARAVSGGMRSTPLVEWLTRAGEQCGWGRRSSYESARDQEAAIGYLIKTAGKHERAVGEVAKLTQLPTNAPARFRRLRPGRRFLPPRRKNENVTGTLVRRRWMPDGTPQVEPLHNIVSAQSRELAAECCYREERIWRDEAALERTRAAWMRVSPELAKGLDPPPVQTFLRGKEQASVC